MGKCIITRKGNSATESSSKLNGDFSYESYLSQVPVLGFINNVTSSSYIRCGYNLSTLEANRLGLARDYSGGNPAMTHSISIDFTNINKLVVNGATSTNNNTLQSTAYMKISPNISETFSENGWILLGNSTGQTSVNFSTEIDCSGYTGEQYIYWATKHGTEVSQFTAISYLDEIKFY